MSFLNLRLLDRPLINIVNNHLIEYPTPLNINYLWNFGSIAGIFLVIQIITGVFLAMHYTSHIDLAFLSVEHIMRDVNNGWFLRYLHANGASLFFAVVYIHIARGIYFNSYQKPKGFVWCIGVFILILMMATAFIGYVLPWGQMSFWGATVITNLFSAFPLVGESIVAWLWGGFSVDNATLNRFFSFHYLLPFLIIGFVLIHLIILHQNGTDNYIEANSMVTPSHIIPEWYFLGFYAILRSIPHKLGGVFAMFASLLILLLLPYLNLTIIRSSSFRPLHKQIFWIFILNFWILGWIGGCSPETPYLEIGQISTFFYFFYFLLLIPFLGYLEKKIMFFQTYCDN